MTALQQAEKLNITMTPVETARSLQWIVKDIGNAYPCIESCPGVWRRTVC